MPPPAPATCSQKGVASARAAQELGQQSRTSGARATQELGQQSAPERRKSGPTRQRPRPSRAAPQVERGAAAAPSGRRRRSRARAASRAPRRRRSGATEPPRGDVPDEWEPLYSTRASKSKEEPEAEEEEEAPLFVVDSAPAAANVVRVAYDGGEAELPAPAYFGALRAATAAARLDALERTARRAERALRDAPDDDEAVRPPAVERTDDATDAALARPSHAQAGQGPRRKRKTRAEKRAPAKDAGPVGTV